MGQFFGRQGDINIIFEPAQRYSHDKFSINHYNQLRLELAQETQIVSREEADLADAVLEHGDTLHAHAEGEAAIAFGIVADLAQQLGMDHAGAENFQPAGMFAEAEALAIAENAANIDLGAWLCEWEVAAAEAQVAAFAEHLTREPLKAPFKISHRTIFVNQ